MTALLNWLGTVDFDKERFTILVINGNSTGNHSFTIQLGNGSDAQDFDDDNLINFSTSGLRTVSNSTKSDPRKEETTEETIVR